MRHFSQPETVNSLVSSTRVLSHLALGCCSAACGVFLYQKGISFSVALELGLALSLLIGFALSPGLSAPVSSKPTASSGKHWLDFAMLGVGFLLIMTVSNRIAYHIWQVDEAVWHATSYLW